MKLLYFAWLRTKIGKSEEEVAPPPEVQDVAGLLLWLQQRGPDYAQALANPAVIRFAVNQAYVRPHHPIRGTDEIALFPPVTGG
jgi:molybdopterin synthase sulfur carrier subunit